VQAYRNVSFKPLLANAEVSASLIRLLHNSDAVIQITSSMNLRKSSASLTTLTIDCTVECDAEQWWSIWL